MFRSLLELVLWAVACETSKYNQFARRFCASPVNLLVKCAFTMYSKLNLKSCWAYQ
jgi:hypothetical protein